jgi:ABC-type nitrate/sulfonate/bicarbonate transport system substrate-binding protein
MRSRQLVKGSVMAVGLCAFIVGMCMSMQAQEFPEFSLAWSEYPSWSTFGVAAELKLIDAKKGEYGELEKKWKVDIVLKEADYDSCLVMYGANQCDAVCITNMDALNPSLTRPSVAILPTSTSHGADALIVAGSISDIKQLKGKKVYGLAKTVSEYCFVRNLEILGEKEQDYAFTNMDPAAAAMAMQQKRDGYDAIVVWNPFVLETLNKRKDARILFDSTTIPGEIIDMVVVAQTALDKPGGDAFAHAVIDAFYRINQRMASPETRDDTLIGLGEKFSNLNLESMRKVVKQTRFYATPEEGIAILTGDDTVKIMNTVRGFCLSHEIVPQSPVVAFGDKDSHSEAHFRFDPMFIQNYLKTTE